MGHLSIEDLRGLLTHHEPPCISLYQPTNRRPPDNQQDPVRFRNLVKAIEASLLQKFPTVEVRSLLEPFHALADDTDFWNHSLGGLAVLGSRADFRVFTLQRPVPELVVVAESFHTKPLLRIVQSADRYQVLCVRRREVKFYEGDRDSLDEVVLETVPRKVTEVRGEEETARHKVVGSFGNELGSPFTPDAGAAMYQGQGATHDDVAGDSERFFRAVDREILEHRSRPSGLPLLLAATPENQAYFRKASHNPFLVEPGIEIDPFALSADQIRERAWKIIEPRYQERLSRLVEEFGLARSRGLASEDPAQVGEAAVAGRVGTLLVEADRVIEGRVDEATGRVELGAPDHALVDDLLDDLAELVLKRGGDVVVVPADRMPTQTGLAATYRF